MRSFSISFSAGLAFVFATLSLLPFANATERHPRKYKSPPLTAHVEVTVLKASTGKPLRNAAVVFHPLKGTKDEGNMELKTNEEGKAILDVIPIGTDVLVQVIVPGFRTFGQEYEIATDKKLITIKLLPPEEQYSVYSKNNANSDVQNNAPQAQMGHAAPADSPLLAPADKKKHQ